MTSSKNDVPGWLGFPLTIVWWFFVAFFSVVYNLCALILIFPLSAAFENKKRAWMHAVAVLWAKSILLANPAWRMEVTGKENIQPGRHYVVVANHQSLLDIFVVLAALPVHFKFMAKKELFSIPFVGWHMSLAAYIPIDRSSVESGKNALFMARDRLSKKISVLFFPEGTRSTDGEIKAFKAGAFKAAQDEGVEILPVVIEGTGDAIPKKSKMIKKVTRFVLSIGKPVQIGPGDSLEKAKEAVRESMILRLSEIRARRS